MRNIIMIFLLLAGALAGSVSGPGASPPVATQEQAVAPVVATTALPRPPGWVVDEVYRTFQLGARAGKGGWPRALPPVVFNDKGLDAAYSTFAAIRNGDPYDRVVAYAACYAMSQGPADSKSPRAVAWKSRMYNALPADWGPGVPSLLPNYPPVIPPGPYNWLIRQQIDRIASAFAVFETNPGSVSRYYNQYCF